MTQLVSLFSSCEAQLGVWHTAVFSGMSVSELRQNLQRAFNVAAKRVLQQEMGF